MIKNLFFLIVAAVAVVSFTQCDMENDFTDDDLQYENIQLDESVILDKIKGGYVGQMAGVVWGFPTEFYFYYLWNVDYFIGKYGPDGYGLDVDKYLPYMGKPIPINELPVWNDNWINDAYSQDDLYIEVPYIDAMKNNGVTADWVMLGEAYNSSGFKPDQPDQTVWHANQASLLNLRKGIKAPESGHYLSNKHCDDIDWQIEVDFVGLMNPGQVSSAIEIAWRNGHVMNYGDGVYGGVFVASMEAAAFTATSIDEIIQAGRNALPAGSKYRAVIDTIIANHDANMTWEQNWWNIQDKWGVKDRCPEMGETGPDAKLNIDAKMNGGYILIGLLYGNGDFEQSIKIAMACGQDSDCNPSNVGGILGIYYGFENIDQKFHQKLDYKNTFSTTDYTLNDVINLNLELAREVVTTKGGEAPKGGTWKIPVSSNVIPPILEQWPENEANDIPELKVDVIVKNNKRVRFEAYATDNDGIDSYQWFFGDLIYANGAKGIHTYKKAGTYKATCYVTDKIGNTGWKQVDIVVE